jgi:alpha-L-fucosidase
MAFRSGSSVVSAFKFGSTSVDKVYLGSNLVATGGGSTALLTGASSNDLGGMVHIGSPWRSVMPFPDAQTTTGDAAVLGKMYGRDGTFNKLYTQQMAYVAQGRGLMPVLDVATFIGSENAPGTTAASLFAPSALNVDQWVTAAQAMHATYVVPITVHSAGLCYWPTATTTYNITATSIPTVDLVGQICTKFRAAGIAVVPYWSIWQGNKLLSSPTQAQYRTFLESQITELFALYGPFPGFWCDGGLWHFGSYYPWTNAADMKNFIHSIQPSCVVINNTHAGNLEDSDLVEYEGGTVPSATPCRPRASRAS